MDQTTDLLLEDIRVHLEGLKRTVDGDLLYRMIERGLAKHGVADGPVAGNFIRFMHTVLGRYANDKRSNPVTRVKARLIQQYLLVHLPAADSGPRDHPAVGITQPLPRQEPATSASPALHGELVQSRTPADAVADSAEPDSADASSQAKHELVNRIAETIEANDGFNRLLRSNLRALKLAESAEDLLDLKELLVKGMEDLLAGAGQLGGQLGETSGWLEKVEREKQQLEQHVRQAAQHSPLDQVTGLPQRDTLYRQLRAEVGRAQRYGFSVALGILGVDGLERLTRDLGDAAAEEVLRAYGREVFSMLRAYDVAVRYDEQRFAVLLPNTQRAGAEKTLAKLQKRATELAFEISGVSHRVPGFSSVLTMYVPGEDPEGLLKRAARTLYLAQQRGNSQNLFLAPAG
ncbi:MAG: diguanylate cyclase [Gammaproteobacteria bacterium]|nr:diguanylate cyclase [Gammaproteobacteria bacterium]